MNTTGKAQLRRFTLTALMLCACGCVSSSPEIKPQLSVNDQAEALAHFSMGLLSGRTGDPQAALEHFQQAIRIDPQASALYPQAIASALHLQHTNEAIRLCKAFRTQHPQDPQPLLMHAEVCALTEQPQEAERLLREAVHQFPQLEDTHLALARFLMSDSARHEEAISLLESAPTTSGHADSLAMLGGLYIARARNQQINEEIRRSILQGIDQLDQSLEIMPNHPQRLQQLTYAYLALNNKSDALITLEKAAQVSPGDATITRQRLALYTELGMIPDALAACDELIRLTRTDPEIWTQYLLTSLPEDKSADLAKYLQQYIDEHADAPLLYSIQLGTLYLNEERIEEADAVLTNAKQRHSDDSRLEAAYGYLQLQKKQYSDAYKTFREARESDPQASWTQSSLFQISLALTAQKVEQMDEAADILSRNNDLLPNYMQLLYTPDAPLTSEEVSQVIQKVQARHPDLAEPFYYQALIQFDLQDYEGALLSAKQFEKRAVANGQTNLLGGSFYYQFASLHEQTGEIETAEQLFRKAIRLGPAQTTAAAQNYIAYMWAERGKKLDMGLELISQALKTDPENPAFIDTLGWIYYMQGKYTQALTELEKAGELMPDDPSIREHIGDTYLKLGDRGEAIKHWKKAAELAPDETALLERIEQHSISQDDRPAPADSP